MRLDLTEIARDVPGSEGPVFDGQGSIYFVAPNLGQVRTLRDGKQFVVADTGGIPAGLQCDAAGVIWIADMKRGVLRLDPDGSLHDVLTQWEGQPVRGCNDLAFDDGGNLYVTAPAGSNAEQGVGEIFFISADGSARRIDGGYHFCNGIAVSPDGKLLVIAETLAGKTLHAFDIDAPGSVSHKRAMATMPGDDPTGADGMDFDATGRLLATNWGGNTIDVFDGTGRLIDRCALPAGHPSNVHLGGADGRDLLMTEHGSNGLWRGRWDAPGIRMPHTAADAKAAAGPIEPVT